MKLSKDQQGKLIEKLSKYPTAICSFCGNNSWSLSDFIVEFREFQGGGLVIGGASGVIPAISLCCNVCGNSLFLNAIKLGLIKIDKKLKEESEKAGKEELADQGKVTNNE